MIWIMKRYAERWRRSAGEAPDASAIAEATLNTWRQVAARLAPVIGARGVDALFSRSLHVTSQDLPWAGHGWE